VVGRSLFFISDCLGSESAISGVVHPLYEIQGFEKSSKTEIDGSGDLEKMHPNRHWESVNTGPLKHLSRSIDFEKKGGAWRPKSPMRVRPAHFEEMFSVFSCSVILAVAGCSCLNGNKGLEPALTTASKPPATAYEAVGLPGVAEVSKVAENVKTDSAVGQASFKPEIDNPELQQKFNNLQDRFQQRVDQTQSSVKETANQLQNQTQKSVEETRAQIQNQSAQIQDKVTSEARKTQQTASELATSAKKSVTSQVNSTSQKVGTSLNNAADKVGQATSKATTSAGKFFDSLLPIGTTKP
jgi:hypothetical protein